MSVERLDNPERWEIHDTATPQYYTNMREVTARMVLEEEIGIPVNQARRLLRLARAQGPTIVTDNIVLIPPRG